MAKYDKLGPVDVIRIARDYEQKLNSIRQFLWDHWSGRRLGYVETVLYTIEGARSLHLFFIEPDDAGMWQLVHGIASSGQDFGDDVSKNAIQYRFSCASVLRRHKVNSNGQLTAKEIPATVSVPSSPYRLAILFAGGRERAWTF